jgi:hypothetical protein
MPATAEDDTPVTGQPRQQPKRQTREQRKKNQKKNP